MDKEDKIINLFNTKRDKESLKTKETSEVSEGFHFVKMDKDAYGRGLVQENIEEYAKNCHYIVRVMKTLDKKVFLYNYEVPPSRLYEFLTKVQAGKINGKIIEIDKYFPENII